MAGVAEGTPRGLFVEVVRPALEQLVARGRIGAWGISGNGVPTAILETINLGPASGRRSSRRQPARSSRRNEAIR
jgi:hypothetical protein